MRKPIDEAQVELSKKIHLASSEEKPTFSEAIMKLEQAGVKINLEWHEKIMLVETQIIRLHVRLKAIKRLRRIKEIKNKTKRRP